VIVPADAAQTRAALLRTWNLPGPVYYRLGKDNTLSVPGLEGQFELGKLQASRGGADLVILAMGGVAAEAAVACEKLRAAGVDCGFAVLAAVQPPPVDALATLLTSTRLVLTVEAHYETGGLGSLVAEVLAENALRCRLVRCGVKTTPDGRVGSRHYMHKMHGLDTEALVRRAMLEIRKAQP